MRTVLVTLLFFCTALGPLAAESSDHWLEVRSPHFVVLTDSSERQARRVAVQLEQMRSVLHTLNPGATGDSGEAITVLAFKDLNGLKSVLETSRLAKGEAEIAGMFMRTPDRNFILLRVDALDSGTDHPFAAIYHEYTHLMMRKSAWLPLWLNEGLAEFYQNSEIQKKTVLMGEPDPGLLYGVRANTMIPLATLLMVNEESPYYHKKDDASEFYVESWALTHYLMINDYQKNTNHLQEYERRLRAKEDPLVAAKESFGDLTELERLLTAYVMQPRFSAFQLNSGFTVDAASFAAQPVPTPNVNILRAEVLISVGRVKEAEALLTETLREVPNSSAAHERMGYVRLNAKDNQGALKWFGEAVKLDSPSYQALYHFGALSLQTNGRDHDAEIEASLREAIKMQPDFAPAYDTLAQLYASRQEKLEEAHRLNIQAVTLEPENLAYRLNTANVLMQEKEYESAMLVLKAAAKMAKTPEESAMVQTRVGEAEKSQKAAGQNPAEGGKTAPGATGQASGVEAASANTTAKVVVFKKVDGKMMGTMSAADGVKYPEGEAKGAKHTVRGTIRSVQCSPPNVLAFTLEGAGGKKVALYNNNFYKITFTTVNYTPEGDILPCTGIEGMKAQVEYAGVTDPQVVGQVTSIELSR